ncbi:MULTISPECIES: DUF3311 domain-containing protein [unclassified Haladaptatus]|uniref:DUF3311 domain-containing protein n=1 Tax=unclassified Haladaptatus TaxID=2622732 RepID=UPI0023E8B667|nr:MULTISPECIES: DUF3311 domain-containing protein [unclassified Haladaptatus]
MPGTWKYILWIAVALVLVALSVPWFLWGDSRVAFGLPLWIWWHVGWMFVTAGAFYVFAQRAWGLGVEGVTSG